MERGDVHKQRTIGIQRVDLEALLDRFGSQSVDILKGSRIYLQTVFDIRSPFSPEFIFPVLQRQEFHRSPIPERIMLGIEMDGGSIYLSQWSREGEDDILVGIKLR